MTGEVLFVVFISVVALLDIIYRSLIITWQLTTLIIIKDLFQCKHFIMNLYHVIIMSGLLYTINFYKGG